MKKSLTLLIAAAAMAYSLNVQAQKDIVTTRGTFPAESEPFLDYAKGQLYADDDFEPGKFYHDLYVGVELAAETEFSSFTELVASIPDLPSAARIISSPKEAAAELAGFVAASDKFTNNQMVLSTPMPSAGIRSASAAYQTSVPPEFMALAAMDPEKMSEEELMAIAMKMAAQRKASGAGVLAVPEYSKEQDEAIDDLTDRLDAISDMVGKFAMTYAMTGNALDLKQNLSELHEELTEAWPVSEECLRVSEIEKDIDGKALKYFADKHIYDFTGERFPQCWYDGRKEQNEIIAAYNIPAATRWRNTVQAALDAAKPVLDELVAIDEKLEKTFTDKNDKIYKMLKLRVSQAFFGYMPLVTGAMSYVYDYPSVGPVSETNDIS